ncbi:MAG TPA: endonuclease/exonuclease/phosphatase family protein [Streptosporangiaceae bacterium]
MMRMVALALSAVSWPSLASRALGGAAPRPLPQLAALAPAATVPAVAAVPVAATRSWRLALALAVPAAVLAGWQLPPRRPRDAQPDGPDELRLLTLNAEAGQADAEQLVGVLASLRVDVLAGQEITPELVARLDKAGLSDLLPYAVVDAAPAYSGAAVWSRWPLRAAEPVAGLTSAAPRAELNLGGRPVTVTSVHVLSPVHGRDGGWQHELGLLGSLAAEAGRPALLAGDFNASRDHGPFRRLVASGYVDCADVARKRPWPAVTWPSGRRRLPVMRLDHVLASRGDFTVRESRTIRIAGTDHRAVFAVLRV